MGSTCRVSVVACGVSDQASQKQSSLDTASRFWAVGGWTSKHAQRFLVYREWVPAWRAFEVGPFVSSQRFP